MENEKSVAQHVITMEDGSGEGIKSPMRNTKTKVPLQLYFEKTTKGQVRFTGAYMEIYIPQADIERKNTVISGREVYTFGIFQIKIWDTIPENPQKNDAVYTTRYMYPSMLVTLPSMIIKRTMSLVGEEESPHMVLGYHKGDIFIKALDVAKNSEYTQRFLNIISKAFLPPIVRYTEIADLLFENASLNNVNFNVNASCLEIMIAAQARYIKDLTVPFRMYLNRKGTGDAKLDASQLSFIKSNDIPNVVSTFTAFSFQNLAYAITASARRHRKGLKNRQSNVEKTIKF
jgi:hypothetical protein